MSTQREEMFEEPQSSLELVETSTALHLAAAAMAEAQTEQEVATDDTPENIEDEGVERDVYVPGQDPVRSYLNEIGKTPLLNAEEEVEIAKRIEAGLFAAERLDSGENLPAQLHKELRWIAEDGQRAKERFLRANLLLVVSVSKTYKGLGMEDLDLIQEGNLGLVRAVEKFDYTKGYKFSTYATWWIRQAITRGLADQGRTIQVPVHVHEKINRMVRVSRALVHLLDREPTAEEIADAYNKYLEDNKVKDWQRKKIDAAYVEKLQRWNRKPESLEKPVGENEGVLGDLLEDETSENPAEAAMRALSIEGLRAALESLDYRQRWVLTMRFGLDNGVPKTLDEIGHTMGGITRSKVQTIVNKALAKLKDPIIADKLRDFVTEA